MTTYKLSTDPIYITTSDAPQELFPGLECELVSTELNSSIREHVYNIAHRGIKKCFVEFIIVSDIDILYSP
jgi:hypothetical protein